MSMINIKLGCIKHESFTTSEPDDYLKSCEIIVWTTLLLSNGQIFKVLAILSVIGLKKKKILKFY